MKTSLEGELRIRLIKIWVGLEICLAHVKCISGLLFLQFQSKIFIKFPVIMIVVIICHHKLQKFSVINIINNFELLIKPFFNSCNFIFNILLYVDDLWLILFLVRIFLLIFDNVVKKLFVLRDVHFGVRKLFWKDWCFIFIILLSHFRDATDMLVDSLILLFKYLGLHNIFASQIQAVLIECLFLLGSSMALISSLLFLFLDFVLLDLFDKV